MGKRRFGIAALLAALIFGLGGCGGSDGLCGRLAGIEFRSEDAISSTLGPEGVEPSYELVEFSETEATWFYFDVAEFGEWECRGDRVSFLDHRFEADVLEEDDRLVLDRDGIRYLEEP